MANIAIPPEFINKTMRCFVIPPKVNSHGVLEDTHDPFNILGYTLPLLEFQMGIILITSYAVHYILRRIGASLFVSCVIAGIILGPTFLGKFDIMKRVVFPHENQDTINALALFGYNMFLFLSAVKMDVGMIMKTGDKALSVGVVSVMAPLMFSLLYQSFNEKNFSGQRDFVASWTIVIMQSLTSFPVTAYVVGDQLKISNSELGRLALSSALVADILGIFTVFTLTAIRQATLAGVIRNYMSVGIFVLLVVFIFRPAMIWAIKRTPERKPVDISYIIVIVALAIASEASFHWFNQLQFLGPFIFGLAVPSGAPLGSALVEKFAPFTLGILVQIVVTTAMMRADPWLIVTQFAKLEKFIAVIFVINAFKLLSCLIPSLLSKIPLIDSMALSLIMNCKGIVELCICVVFRDTKFISEEVFALTAISIAFNAYVIPILVKCLYDPSRKYAGYQARNIMSLKPNSELRILACIHRPDNIDSVIRLLDASYPTKLSPIGVHALHLIKLVGRSMPELIFHSKEKTVSNSTSQFVIHSFNQYEQNNWGNVSVQTATAISPTEFMYEDICTLALDRLTSLILTPLHRKWSVHGIVEYEDKDLRALNCKVLEKAPCSVGIFFDRGRLGRQTLKAQQQMSIFSLCMIFLGGSDDREALSLAKRMVKNSSISLTVVHFIARENMRMESEEQLLDDVALEAVKQLAARNVFVQYKEHVVDYGPETISIIRSMANLYDLFVLGRRYDIVSPQTLGLSEWSELPELGIIGDFFASKDLSTKASVLVVQQQKQIRRLE